MSIYQYEKALLDVIDSASYIFSDETSEFLSFVWDYLQGRVLFITDDGQFGLGPEASQPGDSVYVLLGSDLPFVLRSAGQNENQVVGPCYCSGLMNGEALLGPLPPNQRLVDAYSTLHRGYDRAFLDTRTGLTQLEDPRVELPKGWTKKEDTYLIHIDDRTGEEVIGGDPRVMLPALRERGIETVDIVLI